MKNRGLFYLSSIGGGALLVLALISCGQVVKETSSGVAGVGATNFTAGATVQTSGVRAAGVSALATGSITGRITDCFTGDPIAGATVYASTSVATSDASGNYSLSGVPSGNLAVTAAKVGYSYISVVSAASTINFGLIKMYSSMDQASYPTGIITGEVLNSDGSRLTFGSTTEGTKSIYRYGSIYVSSSTYNAWGYGSVSAIGTYEMTAPAGSLYLSLSRYESIYDSATQSYSSSSLPGVVKTGVTLTGGERKTVNFQLPAAYGTIEGMLSSPAGYNYTSGFIQASILEGNLGALVSYKSLVSGESAYSLLVPPSSDVSYALIGGSFGSNSGGYFGGIAFNYGITISGGERQTKNFTVLSSPQLVSPSHNASGVSVTGETFSWTKPSDWDPDFYAIFIGENYGSAAGFSLMALIPKDVTSFQLPAQLNLTPEKSFYWGIAAVKSAGADVNNFNLRTLNLEGASFMARYFTSGKAANVLARIAVTPSSASVIKGQQQQFSATGYDSYDNPVSLSSLTWSVTDRYGSTDSRWAYGIPGTINSSGLFTASSEAAGYSFPKRGFVKAQSGSISGTAIVTVEAAVTTTTQGTTTTLGKSVQTQN